MYEDISHLKPTREARDWAMWLHLSALIGLLANGIGFLLAPLIVWYLKRGEHPFIDENGKEAVNFQITMMLANLLFGGSLFLSIFSVIFGPLICLLTPLMGLALTISIVLTAVMPIVAAVKASNGEIFRYPLTIRFIK